MAPTKAPNPTRTPTPTVPPTPAPTPVAACGLLSGAEVAGILGVDTAVPRPMPAGGWIATQCAWSGPASGFFVGVGTKASLKAAADPGATDAKEKLAQFKAQAGDAAKNVSGVGDGAVLGPTGLAVRTGSTYLQITNLGLTEAQLIKVAKLAVKRA